MELLNQYLAECQRKNLTTDREKAKLLYELVADSHKARFYYGISKGHSHSQFRLRSKIEPVAFIQATKYKGGHIEISIQGLRNIAGTAPNFVDFFDKKEPKVFLEYLKLF